MRHLLILAGLLALAAAIYALRQPDAVGRLVQHAGSVREGADEARALATPDDLLAWVRAHPERASLVVLDGDSVVLTLGPDTPRPAPALPALVTVAAYRAAVADDALDPAATVGPEATTRRRLAAAGRPPAGAASPVTLDSLAALALTGDRAAADALLAVVGREAAEAAPARLGLPALAPPLPVAGLLAAWLPPGTGETADEAAADAFAARPDAARRDAAWAADAALVGGAPDPTAGGVPLGLDAQRRAFAASLPRGTASGYARLLAQLAASGDAPPYVGGAVPGAVAGAAAVRTPEGVRVAVLLAEDVPHAVFYHLTQKGLEAGMLLALARGER